MRNLQNELAEAEETILDQKKIIAERDAKIAQLEKENLELKSGQKQSFTPVGIDMKLDKS